MVDRERESTVAIVDDDGSVRTALVGLLKSAGIPARAYSSAEEFLCSRAEPETSCLVVDLRMPGMSGLELQAHLGARSAGIPVIFITAHGDAEARARALRAGAVRFFEKPFDDEELLETIRAATGSGRAGKRARGGGTDG
jgi:two-component system, LuxR family, response regulator FixJ